MLNYWADLASKGLVGKQDQFTTDYISGVVNGKYATYTSAAWAPGYLTGAGVGKGDSKGVWAVAPLPQWDEANPVSVNWGGSAFAVTTQATDKKLAADRGQGHLRRPGLARGRLEEAGHLPAQQERPRQSAEFAENKTDFFSGQQANKEVYLPAEDAYKGVSYAPITTYYYAQFQAELGQDQLRQGDR